MALAHVPPVLGAAPLQTTDRSLLGTFLFLTFKSIERVSKVGTPLQPLTLTFACYRMDRRSERKSTRRQGLHALRRWISEVSTTPPHQLPEWVVTSGVRRGVQHVQDMTPPGSTAALLAMEEELRRGQQLTPALPSIAEHEPDILR